ncbi:MAG TPA: hypothetical protein VF799_10415 [Geobacteraceae bacterium]
MLTYTIEQNSGLKPFVRKILHVEGNADRGQRERLHTLFFDALSSSDHLILDIEEMTEQDNAFPALICSMRRMAKLLGKRLTIQGQAGAFMPCRHQYPSQSRRIYLNSLISKQCYLWEHRSRRALKLTGRLKRQLRKRKHDRESIM